MKPENAMQYVMMFQGGPLDGQLLESEYDRKEWRVPFAPDPVWDNGDVSLCTLVHRYMTYVRTKVTHVSDTIFMTMVPENTVGSPDFRMN